MRNVTRAGKSQYYVNGKPSNFTDVTDTLQKRGIDLTHKRFLILQGEVESISQMKPKAQNEHEDGLLEYLEDIIGTSSYKVISPGFLFFLFAPSTSSLPWRLLLP